MLQRINDLESKIEAREAEEDELSSELKLIREKIGSKIDEPEVEELRNELEHLRERQEELEESNETNSEKEEEEGVYPSEISQGKLGDDILVTGYLEFRDEVSDNYVYTLKGESDYIIVKSTKKLPEGQETLEGEVKTLDEEEEDFFIDIN